MKTLAQKINEMKPGQTLEIGKTENGRTFVERTGKGDKLNFVRETGNTQVIYLVRNFNEI